ncbi:hypothetical protein LCGC14_2761520 [marine sediment metagenome]|uniref:Uncharacterized protein n=1 Tax=marine sediment metagenome TaxID=412755 RepID=A0A0F8ZKP0_9ZZZZ
MSAAIPIAVKTIPTYRKILAFLGSSFLKTKYEIIPPINPKDNTNPTHKQFFAFFRSSFFITKYEITPPIIENKIGNRYHQLLLGRSGYMIIRLIPVLFRI